MIPLPIKSNDRIIGVGWLLRNRQFPTGETDRRVFEQLKQLLVNPWEPFASAGVHDCDLCQFEGEAHGGQNLFIPHVDRIFIAPEMILHYMNAHHFKPPDEFCAAVVACPPMRSQAYRAALAETGLLQYLRPPS